MKNLSIEMGSSWAAKDYYLEEPLERPKGGQRDAGDQPGRKLPRGACTSGRGGPLTSAASGLRSRPGQSESVHRPRA